MGQRELAAVLLAFALACERSQREDTGAPGNSVSPATQTPYPVRLYEPGSYEHAEGKRLILAVANRTAHGRYDWAEAYGFLGATLLQCDPPDREAYKTMFSSLDANSKLVATDQHLSSAGFAEVYVIGWGVTPITRPSIIFRREAAFYCIAANLRERYAFDNRGVPSRDYRPSRHRQNAALRITSAFALQVFKELTLRGHRDGTLRDAIAIAAASLERDGDGPTNEITSQLGVRQQVYAEALEAALSQLAIEHHESFLHELEVQMWERDLATLDSMLFPKIHLNPHFEADHDSLLRLLAQDLDLIRVQ